MHAVTCRTEGCENAGFTILLKSPGHVIVCGGCNQQITDIDPPLPDEPYDEMPNTGQVVDHG